jgi:hypothetical protein
MTYSNEIQWKRIVVEATAIVGSILLAFAIDAWWEERLDQVRATEYLWQVRADSHENILRLTEAIQLEKAQLKATQEILTALRSPDPMTLESAREWTQFEPGYLWYSDPRLLEGAISALVATGEVNLIDDHEIKASLINYLGQMKADMNEFDRGVDHYFRIRGEILWLLELARTPGDRPEKDELAHELVTIWGEKEAAAAFRLLERNVSNRLWYLEQMLAATEKFSNQFDSQSEH